MTTRVASHAGSWYSSHKEELSQELDGWLEDVPEVSESGTKIQVPGARVIIAPHAGYSYSGPTAAWAYKALDISNAKRVFLLGPSHHLYLSSLALTSHAYYATPLGPLKVDQATNAKLEATGKFTTMSISSDEDEHSLEMHLPYIYKILSKNFSSPSEFPPIVPILVGSTSKATDVAFGSLLAPYLADPSNVFVISSDFCHWGSRFRYTYYIPSSDSPDLGYNLGSRQKVKEKPIYESIGDLDQQAMEAIKTGSRDAFADNLKKTQNTVCGRHPISIMMATMEAMEAMEATARQDGKKWSWEFIKYERSSDCETLADSSVSYVSAYAVLERTV